MSGDRTRANPPPPTLLINVSVTATAAAAATAASAALPPIRHTSAAASARSWVPAEAATLVFSKEHAVGSIIDNYKQRFAVAAVAAREAEEKGTPAGTRGGSISAICLDTCRGSGSSCPRIAPPQSLLLAGQAVRESS